MRPLAMDSRVLGFFSGEYYLIGEGYGSLSIQSSHILDRIGSGVLGKPQRGREMAKVAKFLLAKLNIIWRE